ncbi:hypothetical protein ACHAPK_010970 [Fusarium culmorum]
MNLIEAIEEVIGCANHGTAMPVFFGRIMISLAHIYPQDRRKLMKYAAFKYIKNCLNGTPDKLFAEINHFGYTAFSMASIARCSGKKKLALKKAAQLKAGIDDDDPRIYTLVGPVT